MPQSDGKNTLKRLELHRVTAQGDIVEKYVFQVNPESYSESFPQRTTSFRTRSAIVVEDFGPDIPKIKFSGTTGFRVVDAESGAMRMQRLKNFLQKYANSGQRVDNIEQPEYELYFHNMTDGGSYVVHIAAEGYEVTRSVERSLLYTYTIPLIVIRDAETPDNRVVDDPAVGNPVQTFPGNTNTVVNPNGSTAAYAEAFDQLDYIIGYNVG